MRKVFDGEQDKMNIKDKSEETFAIRMVICSYLPLDTSVNKLRKKDTSLKAEWQNILDRARCGSGLAPEKEPKWYRILYPVFTETKKDLEVIGSSADVSFLLNEGDDESDISEKESSQKSVVLIMKMYLEKKKPLVVLRRKRN